LNWLAGEIEPMLVAVLSDINMPGMDGLQLLGEIKRRFPDLPVMMVTAYGDDERRRQAGEYGAGRFRFPEGPASRSERRRGLNDPSAASNGRIQLSLAPTKGRLRGMKSCSRREG
jgi:CheY-like chemotaxis protein